MWPDGPRYVVRELEGYSSGVAAISPSVLPGVTVWVGDEAYNGREIRTWRSEDGEKWRAGRLRTMRREAAALADEWNAAEAVDA